MYRETLFQYLYLLPKRTLHLRSGKVSCYVYLYSSLLLILLSKTCVVSLDVRVARNDTLPDGPPDFGFSKPDNASILFNDTQILPTIANPEYLEEIYADNHGMPMECRNGK